MATDYKFEGWVADDPSSVDGKMVWREYEPKVWEETDVDIKITHSGICGSDIHTLRAGWGATRFPAVVGHEIVGVAVRVGSQAEGGIKVGDIVGVGAQSDSCLSRDGPCDACEVGEENYCTKRVNTYNSLHRNGSQTQGGYALYHRCPSYFVIKIPKGIAPEQAAPMLCGGVTVFSPLKRYNVGPGKRVGVIGVGGLGHCAVLFAKALGADKVVAISRKSDKKQDATQLGATDFIATAEDEDWATKNARTLDVIISTVASPKMPLAQYLGLLSRGGTFVQVGAPEEPVPLSAFALIRTRVHLTGSVIGSPGEIREMFDLVAAKGVKVWVETRPMKEANQAVLDMVDVSALLGSNLAVANPLHPRIYTKPPPAKLPRAETSENNNVNPSELIPGAYIVEFADDNDTPETFFNSLKADGLDVESRMDLSNRLFKGVSFQVKNAGEVHHDSALLRRKIESSPRIRSLWPVRTIQLAKPEDHGAPANGAITKANARRQEAAFGNSTKDTFSPHVMTQVDKLREQGITGKGVRIAIIDSGVDYTHPALGGCFGPGCLVEAGWDFTGDDFLPNVRPLQPDADPMDNCAGHGTHVAGIIAAQLEGNEYGFTGAAPGAKLAAYRAWGCASTSTNEVLLAAFSRAFEEGADIISCSDGDPSGWAEDAWGVLAARIVDAGVPVVISEGNDGGSGMFYASTPATGRGVAGSGAVTNSKFPTILNEGTFSVDSNSTSGAKSDFAYLPGVPELVGDLSLQLWSPGENNACSELPDDTPDLSNKIVLLLFPDSRATGCYPIDQGNKIVAKGGHYILFYTNDNTTMRDEQYVYSEGIRGVASIPPYQSDQWLSLLEQGRGVTISIPSANNTRTRLEELENNSSGSYMGSFSSWGPTWELEASPQFAAPGANILSTFPVALGGYRVMTGTSMSCPLNAAIYALLAEAHGTKDPNRLRSIVSSTSKPLAWYDGTAAHTDLIAPVPQQGAGLIQAFDAARSNVELSVDSISFNDTDYFTGNETFTIENHGSADVVFEVTHRKAVTMYTFVETTDRLRAASFPNPIIEEWAELQFSSEKITVPAGGSAELTVTCIPPSNVNATRLPVYSGYIALTSTTDAPSLSLPYLGVVGSMHGISVITPAQAYLANYYSQAPANTTYTIKRPDPANPPLTDRGDQSATPNVIISPTVGTASIEVEVLRISGGKEETLGSLAGWPLPYAPRTETRAFFNGLLADNTVLEPAVYAMKVRALRIFGDRTNEGDWDVVKTVPFVLKYETSGNGTKTST
ncbi:subtilisin Carlsberg [Colletotrichum fioriniae PJ7]|uniref:alcohol dehydrogenase (NADP(+)) n=1 Tax=Colletotrichum fioriniae PJ7 TaxID=1445577 RepID=A0A010QE56_9PEZI|nr:subtilisin Carlsberg [Colletotrichum fioriniae PJ7]